MASINSLSSYSSLFANKNVISGLASGLDTETLIENAVSGIKLKITNLQQKRTKVEWEQNSLRSIIDKMADFTQKYTSYTSNTNLASASFFNSAVTVRTDGEFAGKVSASGKTSSDIQILGVKQLAKAATYSVSGTGSAADVPSISGSAVDFTEKFKISNVAGSMTVNYGGSRSFDLQFSDSDLFNSPAELAAEIEKQLKDISLTNKNGETVTADSMVGVRVEGGNVVFSDKQNAGNSVYVSSASGRLKDTLGITPGEDATSLQTNGVTFINDDAPLNEYLSGKELSVTLDGLTRTVKLPSYQEGETAEDFLNGLQTALDDAFGYTADGKSKIDLSESSIDENGKLSLKLTAQRGSTLRVAGDAARAMGLGSDDVSTYLDTSKTLGELGVLDKLTPTGEDAKGNDTYKLVINDVTVGEFTKDTALESVLLAINNNDDVGVNVNYSRTTNRIQFTAREAGAAGDIGMGEGLASKLFGGGELTAGQDAILSMSVNGELYENISRSDNSFEVDGLTINLKGTFNYEEDARAVGDTLDSGKVLYKIDPNGAIYDVDGNQLRLNEEGYLQRQNADGVWENVKNASNPGGIKPKYLNEDGYFVNSGGVQYKDENGKLLQGTALIQQGGLVDGAEDNAVSFTSSADTETIVDAIKSMIEDYNAMATEIKNAYSTMPATKSNGARYEPLTDEDREGMSESLIKEYEEKAKQGILFADRDLSNLYSRLTSAINMTGADGATLRSIGITSSYSDGITTLSLNEKTLRSALESDPDKVRDVFTKSVENGSSSNGLMASILSPLNTYGKVTGDKGILVQRAGSVRAPATLSSNTIYQTLNNYDKQIERWEEKLSDQVDRYTSKYTQLEQLIAELNSQSSALAQFGGY